MSPDRRARSAPESRPHRVVVLAMDGVLPFELGIPHRIFGRPRDAEGRLLYEVLTCSIRPPGPVRTDADFAVQVEHGPEILATADTVIVPASYELGPVFEQGVLTDELAAALAHIRPGTRLASICTGVYVLAAAGLLDGRPATTHWADSDRLQRLFPQVKVDPEVLFIDDGEVLTSAGVAAGFDPCPRMGRSAPRYDPVPAQGAPPPGRGHHQGGPPPHRRTAAPRRRSGAVHPPPGARSAAVHHHLGPCLGARPPPRADPAAGHGRAGGHVRTHLHAPLPRGGRRQPRPVAHPAAGGTRPPPPGVHRPLRRPGRPRRRLRHRPVDAPAPANGPRRHTDRLSTHLPNRH